MKIAVQAGMSQIETLLKDKGYHVVPYGDSDQEVKITIINDVVEEYEEIDPVTFYGPEGSEMVLLDGSKLSSDDILKYVEKYAVE